MGKSLLNIMEHNHADRTKIIICSIRLIFSRRSGFCDEIRECVTRLLFILAKSLSSYQKLRRIEIQPVPGFNEKILRMCKVPERDFNACTFDIDRTVGICSSVAKYLGLTDCEWISVTRCDKKLPKFVRLSSSMLVQIAIIKDFDSIQSFCLPKSVTDGIQVPVFMSYSLLHNLSSELRCSYDNLSGVLIAIPRISSCKIFNLGHFKLFRPAKVVRLAQLTARVEKELPPGTLDKLVKQYFSKPKFLAIGNVISLVEEDDDIEAWLQVAELDDETNVFKAHGENVYRTDETTSVYLYDRSTRSRLPEKAFKEVKILKQELTAVPWLPEYLMVNLHSLCEWWEAHCSLSWKLRVKTDPAIVTEMLPLFLLSGNEGSGKYTITRAFAALKGLKLCEVDAADLVGDTSAFTIAKISTVLQRAEKLAPCLLVLKNVHQIGYNKDGKEDRRVILSLVEQLEQANRSNAVERVPNVTVVGVTSFSKRVLESAMFRSYFVHETSAQSMSTNDELGECIRWILKQQIGLQIHQDVDLDTWISNSNAVVSLKFLGDVFAFLSEAVRIALQLESAELNEMKANFHVRSRETTISLDQLNTALSKIEAVLRKSAGSPQVPKVNWEDVGGLFESKAELIKSVELPLRFPHLFTSGLKRSGILLYGPPGTGKTLLAKAVASEFKLKFFSVKGPELLNMYVGQSEQNVREVFETAKKNVPCVLFFDELDSLAPNRGASGDSGGVMDRVVSQILAGMDGTHSSPGAFIIGATNRVDLIDPALLRPGRFDLLLPVGVGDSPQAYQTILKAVTRKFKLSSDVSMSKLAGSLIKGLSGAEISSLCSEAYMLSLTRRIEILERDGSDDNSSSVEVTYADFVAAAEAQGVLISEFS